MRFKVAFLALALCSFTQLVRAEDAPSYLGQYDPEQECEAAASNPVCAYKTWFYCRVADNDDLCAFIMGEGNMPEGKGEPWAQPLSEMMRTLLDVSGYAFIGTHKVTAERLGPNASRATRRLIGTIEVMDTYGDPQKPGIAYIGSEFYAETRPGRWRIVGWSMTSEGGEGEKLCDDPQDADDGSCKIKINDIPSWADLLRAGKLK